MIIFLIGFMGSGKSTLGKRLARKIDYNFLDMDQEIVKNEEQTVSEIFTNKGELYFRNLETELLQGLDPDSNLVVATGGGAPCFGSNIDIMNAKGVTVYLKMSPACLAGRLYNARAVRPLIANLSSDELLGYIETKLAEREPCYEKAKCVIKAENVRPYHIVSLVFGNETEV
jgi:shikimate kinase